MTVEDFSTKFTVPRKIGKYEIVDFIGEGGTAYVYKVRHVYTGRELALKLVKPEIIKLYPSVREKILEEARLTPQHPNIIEVIDADFYEDLPYLVMEYMPNGSLRSLISGKKLSYKKALEIALKVAEALKCAHEKGVVHLDVKPENILFDQYFEPKLSDFGIAKPIIRASSSTSKPWGSPPYTAPEVWRGEFSPKSDVYSLGMVLAEMLTGKPYGRDIKDSRLKALVERMTEYEPSKRPSIDEVIEELKDVLEAKPRARLVVEVTRGGMRVYGAEIMLDQRVVSRHGYAVIEDVEPGEHTLTVRVHGREYKKKIEVKPGSESKIVMYLERERPRYYYSSYYWWDYPWDWWGMLDWRRIGKPFRHFVRAMIGGSIGFYVGLMVGLAIGGGGLAILLGALGAAIGFLAGLTEED